MLNVKMTATCNDGLRLTERIESRDKLLKYSCGSQWEVDPKTAAALILVGAAVRMPAPGTPASADAVVEMSTIG
jgi:hypothetical protein